MSIASSVARSVARPVARAVSAVGDGGSDLPTPPPGESLLIDDLANYLIDDLGNYLTGA